MDLVKVALVEVVRVFPLSVAVRRRVNMAHIVHSDVVEGGRDLAFGIVMYRMLSPARGRARMLTRRQQLQILGLLEVVLVALELVEAPEVAGVALQHHPEDEVVLVVVLLLGVWKVDHHLIILFLGHLQVVSLVESHIAHRDEHIFPLELLVQEAQHFRLGFACYQILRLEDMVLVLLVLVLGIKVRAVEVEEAVAQLVARYRLDLQVHRVVLLVHER